MYKFTKETLQKGQTHSEFIDLTKSIIENKNRKAPYDNEDYFSYTKSNLHRSEKILRNFQIDKKLYNTLSEGIDKWTWVLLSEPWCGDSSFNEPLLYAMTVASGFEIDYKILLRDENTDVMEHFLTNNGMAIPKLVCLDKDMNILGTWGPRPKALQDQFIEWKKDGLIDTVNEKVKLVNRWYHKDKNQSFQKEFIDLIREWKKKK